MSDKSTQTVDATETSLQILEALVELEGASVTEIASHLSIPKSTTHNHLRTLLENEYIVREDNDYYVGLRFLHFGEHSRNHRGILSVARPEIISLAEKTGELANLNVEEYGRGVFLYRAKGSDAVHMDTYAGKRVYLHTTAFGKAILASLPEARVDEIIDQHGLPGITENTITDSAELKSELEQVRSRGIAYEQEERLPGLCCVAGPIITDGELVGSISVAGPESRMKGEWFTEELPDIIRQATNVIEVNMQYGSN